jgi:hypothetical protein
VFDQLWVPRNAVGYILLYDMEVEEGKNAVNFTRAPEGFKQ